MSFWRGSSINTGSSYVSLYNSANFNTYFKYKVNINGYHKFVWILNRLQISNITKDIFVIKYFFFN